METNAKAMKEERKQDPKTSSDTADEAPVSKKQKADATRSKQSLSSGGKPAPKRNAFFNFLDSQRSTIKGSSQKEVVRRAGEMWRKLTADEKKPYYEMADAARANGKPVRKTPPAKRKTKQGKAAAAAAAKDNPEGSGGARGSGSAKGKGGKRSKGKVDRPEQVREGMAVK